MDRVVLAVALVVVAVVIAWVLRRRTQPKAPAQGAKWTVPAQLHRADFVAPEAPWLVVEFSSETCDSCAATWAKVEPLRGTEVAVQDVSWQAHRDLHERYGIDAAPTVVVADAEGVVRASFVGEPAADELRAALESVCQR